MKWSDIKHLQLEDDDTIRSSWENDDDGGYWIGEITRLVEETDEQYQKRQAALERQSNRLKTQRYETYLKLKKEFEDGK